MELHPQIGHAAGWAPTCMSLTYAPDFRYGGREQRGLDVPRACRSSSRSLLTCATRQLLEHVQLVDQLLERSDLCRSAGTSETRCRGRRRRSVATRWPGLSAPATGTRGTGSVPGRRRCLGSARSASSSSLRLVGPRPGGDPPGRTFGAYRSSFPPPASALMDPPREGRIHGDGRTPTRAGLGPSGPSRTPRRDPPPALDFRVVTKG